MQYIDGDGNIIVPKSVRPIIDYKETVLGNKKGAKRQYRYGNLHIREYNDYYTIHRDKIDPRTDPLAHLLVDAPEYLIAILSAISVGRQIGKAVYKRREVEGKNHRAALCDAARTAFITGSAAGAAFYISSNFMKKIKRSP